MQWLKNNKLQGILLILLLVFFCVYSWFAFSVILQNYFTPESKVIFSWPDAIANYNFVKNFELNTNFQIAEPLNLEFNNIIHPRSTNINFQNGSIVPTAFLGFIFILGILTKIFGLYLVNFFTPLIAVIGVYYFFKLIRKIFDNELIGFISAILLLTLCSFWYYASLTMLSTITFISFLIIGFFYLINSEKATYQTFLAGLFISLALTIRLNEIVWISLTVLTIALIYRKKITNKKVLYFLAGGIIPLSVLLILNYFTYGSALTFGYLANDSTQAITNRLPTEIASTQNPILNYYKLLFIPFGFYIKTLISNFINYLLVFIWPYIGILVLSLILLFSNFKKTKSSIKIYLYLSLGISFLLIIYYGSWKFVDTLVLKNNTIGSSYIRYWLLINILILPFIAYAIEKFWHLPLKKYTKAGLITLLLLALASYSFILVYKTAGDGLLAQKRTITEYHTRAKIIENLLPTDAIILTDRTDKILFPERKVIDFNLNYKLFDSLQEQVSDYQIYYLTLLPDIDINYINEKKIVNQNLKFVNPIQVDNNYRIFRLVNSY